MGGNEQCSHQDPLLLSLSLPLPLLLSLSLLLSLPDLCLSFRSVAEESASAVAFAVACSRRTPDQHLPIMDRAPA
jgi:hypothetical protein